MPFAASSSVSTSHHNHLALLQNVPRKHKSSSAVQPVHPSPYAILRPQHHLLYPPQMASTHPTPSPIPKMTSYLAYAPSFPLHPSQASNTGASHQNQQNHATPSSPCVPLFSFFLQLNLPTPLTVEINPIPLPQILINPQTLQRLPNVQPLLPQSPSLRSTR
jgi:hypothetical protein